MNLSLAVSGWEWEEVYTIRKGTKLEKGRPTNAAIIKAAGDVHNRYGCYSWQTNNHIYYCGSFTRDYVHGAFASNLQGRVYNYLQNHKSNIKTGQINTNLMVFDNIKKALEHDDVSLCLFRFDTLHFNGKTIDFETFSREAGLVRVVEQILIYHYRIQGLWNR